MTCAQFIQSNAHPAHPQPMSAHAPFSFDPLRTEISNPVPRRAQLPRPERLTPPLHTRSSPYSFKTKGICLFHTSLSRMLSLSLLSKAPFSPLLFSSPPPAGARADMYYNQPHIVYASPFSSLTLFYSCLVSSRLIFYHSVFISRDQFTKLQ